VISTEQGQHLAREWGIPFFETSSRLGTNVEEAFFKLASEVKKRLFDEFAETPLSWACRDGQEDVVRILTSDPRVDLNKPGSNRTPLWIACNNRRSQTVKILLASSTTIDTRTASTDDDYKTTPAQQAKEKGLNEIAELIDRYEENPEKVMIELRKELNLQSIFSFLSLFSFSCT